MTPFLDISFHFPHFFLIDIEEQAPPARPPQPKFQQPAAHQQEAPAAQQQMTSSVGASELSSSGATRSGSFNKGLNRSHRASTSSDTDTTGSPSPTKKPTFGKLDRNISEPSISMAEKEKDGKHKKRRSLFKKKPPPSYMALTDDFQRSPILGRRDSSESAEIIPELEEELQPPIRPAPPAATAPSHSSNPGSSFMHQSATVPARLFKPKSSPRLVNKPGRAVAGGSPGDDRSLPSPLQQRRALEDKPSGSVERKGGDGRPPEGPTSVKPAGKKPASRRPPPPPPPYAKRYGAGGLQRLVKKNSEGGDEDDKTSEESSQPLSSHHDSLPSGKDEDEKDDGGGLVMMTVTPASPLVRERDQDVKTPKEEDIALPMVSSSNSMEDLFKDLEEFDELSSSHSLSNGVHRSHQKDYTSIPQEELMQVKGVALSNVTKEELPRSASVPAETNVPHVMEDRPCLTPSPLGSDTTSSAARNYNEGQADDTPPSSSQEPIYAIPMKPPRSKKKKPKHGDNEMEESDPPTGAPPPAVSTKPQPPAPFSKPKVPAPYSKSHASTKTSGLNRPVFKAPKPPPKLPSPGVPEKPENEEERTSSGKGAVKGDTSPTAPPRRRGKPPKSTSENVGLSKPSLRPKPPQMSRMQVDVMLKKQLECASAPVSRTSSPDDPASQQQLRQESSTSTTNLASSRASKNAAGSNTSELMDHEADNCTVS